MNSIKISIIVAAYNVAEWLPRCVNSVIAQTHKNWELLLIDDGSTDGTSDMIDSLAKIDSRIIAIHQENKGLVEVREKGISLATGEFVGFIDGDDAVDPNMYERLLHNALKYKADISHCGLRVCYNGKADENVKGSDRVVVQDRNDAIRDLLYGEWMTPSLCNKLYKRNLLSESCLNKNIINNEDLLRNFVLFKRANKIVYQDFYGYQYWSRENSLSNDKKLVGRTRNVLEARQCIMQNSEEDIKQYAKRSWLSAVVNSVNSLTFLENKDAKKLCSECRNILIQERRNLKLLIKRQRIAAILIILSPTVHRFVYRLYRKG